MGWWTLSPTHVADITSGRLDNSPVLWYNVSMSELSLLSSVTDITIFKRGGYLTQGVSCCILLHVITRTRQGVNDRHADSGRA